MPSPSWFDYRLIVYSVDLAVADNCEYTNHQQELRKLNLVEKFNAEIRLSETIKLDFMKQRYFLIELLPLNNTATCVTIDKQLELKQCNKLIALVDISAKTKTSIIDSFDSKQFQDELFSAYLRKNEVNTFNIKAYYDLVDERILAASGSSARIKSGQLPIDFDLKSNLRLSSLTLNAATRKCHSLKLNVFILIAIISISAIFLTVFSFTILIYFKAKILLNNSLNRKKILFFLSPYITDERDKEKWAEMCHSIARYLQV
jgi:hypothetical protein